MNGNDYFKKFKIAFGILGLTIVVFVFLLLQIIPKLQEITRIQNETQSQSEALADSERKLAEMQKAQEEQKGAKDIFLKAFYKPINEGLDSEAAISEEFGEILQIMRENKIKTRSIQYDYDPQDDNFVKYASGKFHVCRITTDMIATYTEFESFLRDLYRHEHFLEIAKIEIKPYEKNKRILLVNLQMKLYAQRDGSSAPVQTASASQQNTPPNIAPQQPAPQRRASQVRPEEEAGVTPAMNAEDVGTNRDIMLRRHTGEEIAREKGLIK